MMSFRLCDLELHGADWQRIRCVNNGHSSKKKRPSEERHHQNMPLPARNCVQPEVLSSAKKCSWLHSFQNHSRPALSVKRSQTSDRGGSVLSGGGGGRAAPGAGQPNGAGGGSSSAFVPKTSPVMDEDRGTRACVESSSLVFLASSVAGGRFPGATTGGHDNFPFLLVRAESSRCNPLRRVLPLDMVSPRLKPPLSKTERPGLSCLYRARISTPMSPP
mmetsp:Transcript_39966/g.106049  ORF Transcript_39966/g.106049 Transcript_39966/m.106049 type:complete len:218 (-) Transcript_39966:416-1069(-)